MKKTTILEGLNREDAMTFKNKIYRRITSNPGNNLKRDQKVHTAINKISPLNYFAGPHFLFFTNNVLG
ncbi:hypothetical protein [Segetibacter koreensis]|uniref:hypothetical protein n=1 Tax=Segetibacter koreensis TaxID=398037 RepID=UPI0003649254|nr:hypothetical protein [Segetibacter koreensis]